MGDTTITYLESNAINPPDILYVGSKRYEITSGLKVTIKNGEYHSIKSQDPKSLRKFTAKDEDGNDVMMAAIGLGGLIQLGSVGLAVFLWATTTGRIDDYMGIMPYYRHYTKK